MTAEENPVLAGSLFVTTVAVSDLEASKAFFSGVVGLPILDEQPFAIRLGAGLGSQISIRRGQPNIGQTVGHFEVDDIEVTVQDLKSRGIVFEAYETPKTVEGIAQVGPARAAWFKDLDGNVFGLREGPVPGAP